MHFQVQQHFSKLSLSFYFKLCSHPQFGLCKHSVSSNACNFFSHIKKNYIIHLCFICTFVRCHFARLLKKENYRLLAREASHQVLPLLSQIRIIRGISFRESTVKSQVACVVPEPLSLKLLLLLLLEPFFFISFPQLLKINFMQCEAMQLLIP